MDMTAKPRTLYLPVRFMMRPEPREPMEAPMECGMRRVPAAVVERPLSWKKRGV